VLIFLTTGCLRRFFVRLEVSSAAVNGVKTILVQETDDRHGSTPIKDHRDDCPDDAREAVFDSGRKEILWIRAAHYKLVSIKQIVQRILVSDSEALPALLLPGEVSLRKVTVPTTRAIHFWVPDFAPWCSELEARLQEAQPGLVVNRAKPGAFARVHASVGDQTAASYGEVYRAARRTTVVDGVCCLLVPLNGETLENEGVQQDLWAALQANMRLVLLHIQDAEFGAVPFGRFFEQCPDHLRNAGLFDELAVAWFFHEPHLSIACKTVGLKLESKKATNNVAQAKKKSTHDVLPARQETTPQHVRRALNYTAVRPKSREVHPGDTDTSREVHPVNTDQDDQPRQLKKVVEGHCKAPDEGLLQGPLSPPLLLLEAVSVSEVNTNEEATKAALPPISCISRSQVIEDPAL
jgi:hypothetical protein